MFRDLIQDFQECMDSGTHDTDSLTALTSALALESLHLQHEPWYRFTFASIPLAAAADSFDKVSS